MTGHSFGQREISLANIFFLFCSQLFWFTCDFVSELTACFLYLNCVDVPLNPTHSFTRACLFVLSFIFGVLCFIVFFDDYSELSYPKDSSSK